MGFEPKKGSELLYSISTQRGTIPYLPVKDVGYESDRVPPLSGVGLNGPDRIRTGDLLHVKQMS